MKKSTLMAAEPAISNPFNGWTVAHCFAEHFRKSSNELRAKNKVINSSFNKDFTESDICSLFITAVNATHTYDAISTWYDNANDSDRMSFETSFGVAVGYAVKRNDTTVYECKTVRMILEKQGTEITLVSFFPVPNVYPQKGSEEQVTDSRFLRWNRATAGAIKSL